MGGREPGQDVLDVGGELRVAATGYVGQFGRAVAARTPGGADGFADRDGADPAVQGLRVPQGAERPEDGEQGLLRGVRAVREGDRRADPGDVRGQVVEEVVQRQGVAGAGRPGEGDSAVAGGGGEGAATEGRDVHRALARRAAAQPKARQAGV